MGNDGQGAHSSHGTTAMLQERKLGKQQKAVS